MSLKETIFSMMNEALENMDEAAVEVSNQRYTPSYSKQPRGSGSWMFTHKDKGDVNVNDKEEVHTAQGNYTKAKNSAQKWAKERGHSTVYVMEEVELDEAKSDIYHKHMLKALGKTRLPKDHPYTSAVANNGDFVVRNGSGVVARIPKGEHNLK
jgi:hypothetical protein